MKKNAAEPHNGYDQSNKMNKCLIVSNINKEYVNWVETLRLNLDPSSTDEKEIRLYKNTPIKIEKLYINGKSLNIENIKNKIFLS
jgi:hypothetical protein